MKKLYTSILLLLIAMLGFSANAFTITVKADPSLFQLVQFGAYSNTPSVDFSLEGIINEMPFTDSFGYLRITPKSATTTYNATITSPSGTTTKLKSKDVTGNQVISIFSIQNYDGGVIEIYEVKVDTRTFTVNFEGEPSKVQMTINQTVKPLAVGANKFTCNPSDRVTFTLQNGTQRLYEFTVNGVAKSVTMDSGEGGAAKYYYWLSSINDGDIISIKTEYPDIDYRLTFDTEHIDFISYVIIDGVAATDFADGLEVHAGSVIYVKCDTYSYKVNEVKINGVAPAGFSGSYSAVVESDIELYFDVTPIVRDKSFTVSCEQTLELGYNSVLAPYITLESDNVVNTIRYCDEEFPIYLYFESTSTSRSESRVCWVYRNEQLIAHSVIQLALTSEMIADGDEIYIDYKKPYITVNADDASNVIVTLYGKETPIPANNRVLMPANDDSSVDFITLAPAEGYTFTSLMFNGIEECVLPEDAPGRAYTFEHPTNLWQFDVATDLIRDKSILVYASGLENIVNPWIADNSGENKLADLVDNDYVTIHFSALEAPLKLRDGGLFNGANGYTFVNDVEPETYWSDELEDGDVVKFYFQSEEPEFVPVSYTVRGSMREPAVTVDRGVPVNFIAVNDESDPEEFPGFLHRHAALPGTEVVLSAPGDESYNDVYVYNYRITPDELGNYTFRVGTADPEILIYANEATGVESVAVAPDATPDVYNLQGIRVKRAATAADVNPLPAGLYIINGRKTLLR